MQRGAVISAAGGNGTVLAEAERGARRAARTALLRAYLWAVGGAAVLGLVAALALAHRPGVRRRLVVGSAWRPRCARS